MSALGTWNRFWFTPQSDSTLTALRFALGVTVFAWGWSLAPDLVAFYSERGLMPDPVYPLYRPGLFRWWESDAALFGTWAVTVASAAALALGVAPRVAAGLTYVGVASFQYDNPLVLNSGDLLIRTLCAWFALYALFTPTRGMGQPLLGLFRGRGVSFAPAPTWLLRVVQIQMTLIYPFSAIDKLRGTYWRDGTAVLRALELVEFQRFAMPAFLTESLLLGNLLAYTALVLEISLPFLLWTERTRRAAIAIGVVMHLGFAVPIRLGFFTWAILVGYLSFVRPHEMERLTGCVTRPRTRPRAN